MPIQRRLAELRLGRNPLRADAHHDEGRQHADQQRPEGELREHGCGRHRRAPRPRTRRGRRPASRPAASRRRRGRTAARASGHHAPGFQIMTISSASVASPITTYEPARSGERSLADRALELPAGAGRDEPEDDRGDDPAVPELVAVDVEGEPDAEHEHAEPAGVPERAGRPREHAPDHVAALEQQHAVGREAGDEHERSEHVEEQQPVVHAAEPYPQNRHAVATRLAGCGRSPARS